MQIHTDAQLRKAAQMKRSSLPTAAEIIAAHTGMQIAQETREEMERRYAPDL